MKPPPRIACPRGRLPCASRLENYRFSQYVALNISTLRLARSNTPLPLSPKRNRPPPPPPAAAPRLPPQHRVAAQRHEREVVVRVGGVRVEVEAARPRQRAVAVEVVRRDERLRV